MLWWLWQGPLLLQRRQEDRKTQPQLIQTLTDLFIAADLIDEDALHTIKKFVILLYDRKSNPCRKTFAKKSNVQLITPISATLKQLCLKSNIWGEHVCGQALVPAPTLPLLLPWLGPAMHTTLRQCFPFRNAHARRSVWNAHHCMLAMESTLRTELANFKWRFWIIPDIIQVL